MPPAPSTRILGLFKALSPGTSALLARLLEARVEGEFEPYAARLAHDEMDLRPVARELRGEFHNNAGPAGNAFIYGVQSRSIGNREGEMMKADVGAPIE